MTNGSNRQNTGIGHNIYASENADVAVGDIVITNLSSSDLVACTKQFLHCISHRDWKTAKAYLTNLKSVGSLDNECRSLLEILEYKLSIAQDLEANISQNLFLELLRSPRSDTVIKDVVESIFVLHLSVSSETDARHRYEASRHKGSFTEEFFYEKLANKEDLDQVLESGTSDLFEHELCSLVRCAIRCEDLQLATELAEELSNRYPSDNSEILLCLSKSYLLHKVIDGKHFWLINREQMEELEEQVYKCLALTQNSDDFRTTHIAATLLSVTQFQASDLIDICVEHIEEAKKLIPNIRSFLPTKAKNTTSPSSAKKILTQENMAMSEMEFFQVSSAFAEGNITNREVQRWLDKGGDISEPNKETKVFLQIALSAIACDPENTQQKLSLSERLDSFLEASSDKLRKFNTLAIHQLCLSLRRAGLDLHVIKLLEPLLPKFPWCSPALDTYAEALLKSDQIGKLDDLLNRMEGVNESYSFMYIKIARAISSENFPIAIQLTEQALAKFQDSCFYWAVLLQAHHLANSARSEIALAISKIPRNILEKYSNEGLRLLHSIAKTDLPLAESFILEWFIDDPVGMAVNVTNLHFSNLERSQFPVDVQHPSERCVTAVIYSSGKRHFTKLLVDGCNHSEYLLDTNSPLGELLKNADVGEEIELGMKTYKVVEKLPPIVGACRVSTNIRNDINPGTDCFHLFSIESDGVENISNHIDSMFSQKKLSDAEVNGQTLPILMRLNETHPNDLVRGSFIYLCDKASNLTFKLFSNGKIIQESVVLDVLSLAYLSLTGFCHGLLRRGIKLYVTRETQGIVSNWLHQTGSADYLSIAKTENGFIKTTADDIAKDDSVNNLQLLLGKCELLSPQSIDMPEMITEMRDILDISHYSSLKASISHSIPFLCLDSVLCSFYNQLDIELANASQLMNDANIATQTAASKHVECHVQYGLAAPITGINVIELCSQKEKGQYLAAEIVKMYPNNYPSINTALKVLTECCLKSICSAYLGLKGQFSLSEWRYTEHVVYACCESSMVCLEGDSCEQRLAVLISQVFRELKPMSDVTNVALVFFKRFVNGHFLDAQQIDKELAALRVAED